MAYDFDITYKKGSENREVDAFLRMPCHEILCLAISSMSTTLNQQILDFC